MNLLEIRTVLKDEVDPYIYDRVMELVKEINDAYYSASSAYCKKKRDFAILKKEVESGKTDNDHLIKNTLYKISRFDTVRIYYYRESNKFSVRNAWFEGYQDKEMVGCYKKPYDLDAIKEDLEFTLTEKA